MAVSGITTVSARVAAAIATALVLSGCGADGEDASAAASSETTSSETTSSETTQSPAADPDAPRVVQGGEPGAEAEEVPADTTVPPNVSSDADVAFMQMMIPHHAQALTMSRMAPERASDRRVLTIAERIEAGQGPEIVVMATWLEEQGADVPRVDDEGVDDGARGEAEMSGMLTDEELARLEATDGPAFDRLFLTYMIRHHEGAIEMAADTAAEGTDVLVGELRDDLTSTQSAEIQRMRGILETL